jgi:hypothetical protein
MKSATKPPESKNQAIRVLYTRALENIGKLAKKMNALRDLCDRLLGTNLQNIFFTRCS